MFCLDLCTFLGCGGGRVLEGARRVLSGRGVFFGICLAVIECDFGDGSMSGIGAVGAVRICGSLKGRWNHFLTSIRS